MIIGVERADIAPVGVGLTVHVLELMREDSERADHAGDDVLAEVVVALGARGVLAEKLVHGASGEHVNAHRRQGVGRVARHRQRVGRLFLEADDAALAVYLQDAEAGRLFDRHRQAADSQIRVALDVRADHVAVIHLVDVIAGKNHHVLRLRFFDAVNVLIDGVGGPFVPILVDALLRRQNFDVLVHVAAQEAPAAEDVPIEAAGFVLSKDQDFAKAAVDAIGKGEIDNAVEPAERDSGQFGLRSCASAGFSRPRSFASRQNQRQKRLFITSASVVPSWCHFR